MNALQFGELVAAVDPEGLGERVRLRARHRHAVGHRERDDVGEVVLALRVVVRELREPGLELRRGHDHDAGVRLADRLLGGARVFLFDDADNGA